MNPRARRCAVPADSKVLRSFPFHHYKDAFKLTLRSDDKRDLAQLLAARGSGWLERCLSVVRDALVAPFGLKPIGKRSMAPFERLDIDTEEAIFAVDDKHVDVRIAYRTESACAQRQLVATTLVRVHSRFGWAYLCAILPFHFLIVRRQLQRMAKAQHAASAP